MTESLFTSKLMHSLQGAISIAIMVSVVAGCEKSKVPIARVETVAERVLTPAVEADIVTFCGDCHAMPDPASFPKEGWDKEVRRGYDFYYASGHTNLTVPVYADTKHYFVTRAPESLPLVKADEVDSDLVSRFQQIPIEIEGVKTCAISFIDVVDMGPPLGRGILFSEMLHGGIYFCALDDKGKASPPKQLGEVNNPATVRVCDWDADGKLDLIVSDLGSFLPEDHNRGRVVWLRQRDDAPGEFTAVTLQDAIGRVASVEIADLDSDGQLDLLVAEFGWQTTGSIFWLKRAATGEPVEGLTKQEIDPRSGTIHVPIIDINKDGHLDFIALISQHHERIEAMLNDGRGTFRSELIYAAPEPAFGSSSIDLVDINGDGELDVLYTNGDSFDSLYLKPSHGVRWLQNKGVFPFESHEVGKLPGGSRAMVGNFDGDGKRSIVGGSFFAKTVFRTQGLKAAESLVVWKDNGAGEYKKHVLDRGDCTHATLFVSDLDHNGRDDLLVGEFGDPSASSGVALTVWMAR